MAYVPYQFWEKPYDDETALCRGTVFPSLDKPFIGEEAVKNADAQ
ncbi:MAG: spore coat associated protein CotJA [Ruminococcus sp.]|nr:spore coat associated protein CotJA [Ruminococcus sp.]MBR7007569.1 spore coat associated protein CotJA [Ruminococcus sp.]